SSPPARRRAVAGPRRKDPSLHAAVPDGARPARRHPVWRVRPAVARARMAAAGCRHPFHPRLSVPGSAAGAAAQAGGKRSEHRDASHCASLRLHGNWLPPARHECLRLWLGVAPARNLVPHGSHRSDGSRHTARSLVEAGADPARFRGGVYGSRRLAPGNDAYPQRARAPRRSAAGPVRSGIMTGVFAAFRHELGRIVSLGPAFATLIAAAGIYAVFYPQPYLNEALRKVPIALVDQDGTAASRELGRRV